MQLKKVIFINSEFSTWLSCQIVQTWNIWKTTAYDAESKRNRHGVLEKVTT